MKRARTSNFSNPLRVLKMCRFVEDRKAIRSIVSITVCCLSKGPNETFQGPLSIFSIGCCTFLTCYRLTAERLGWPLFKKKNPSNFEVFVTVEEFTKDVCVFSHPMKTVLETHSRSLPVGSLPSRKKQKLKNV